jgi:phage-related protein
MDDVKGREPLLSVRFFRTAGGQEPVREWLLELGEHDRRTVGRDIKTAQLGWPVGMPLIRKLEPGLWEVRSNIVPGTARVIFTVEGRTMVLLHAFTKKSRKTPAGELTIVRRRLRELRADECEEEGDESKTCRHRL